MILDNDLSLTTATAFDLGSVSPGPGNPIKCIAQGVSLTVTITTGATDAGGTDLMVVTCGGADLVEFELPANTLQWIIPVFADGSVDIILPGAQTNV